MTPELANSLGGIFAMLFLIGPISWVVVTRMKIKAGYPLNDVWGNQIRPLSDDQATERLKLLTQENAQLRAELGAIKDRLVIIERIVTDDSHRVASEIEALRRTN